MTFTIDFTLLSSLAFWLVAGPTIYFLGLIVSMNYYAIRERRVGRGFWDEPDPFFCSIGWPLVFLVWIMFIPSKIIR